LNKVYILSHKHPFEDGHEEEKLIGVFFSKKKALATLKDYKKFEGFRDHLEGFYIQECIIDKIDDKILDELIEMQRK